MARLSKRNLVLLVLFGAVSLSLWLVYTTVRVGAPGFPLDDGWIHQTYARNLVEHGEWSYVPGTVSGGSTSPLWTMILSLVYLAKSGPFLGTYLLSLIFFCGAGIVFQFLAMSQSDLPDEENLVKKLPIFGLFFLLEWRMVWAAASGMEIMLYIFIILLFFLTLSHRKYAWLSGLWAGVAIWIRPDGITLLGPILFVLLLSPAERNKKWSVIAKGLMVFLPFIVAYLIFNRFTAGTFLPNTFYAKQTEYAALYQTNLLTRLIQLFGQPWIGAAFLLVPGFIMMLVEVIRQRNWFLLSLYLWAIGYVIIYAVRLPVTYQHARYLMPTMPIFYLLGLLGTLKFLQKIRLKPSRQRLLHFALVTLFVFSIIGFWGLGLTAYAKDTAIIHQEMVQTAIWIRENIPSDEIIAAHDIGALGYYGNHDIVDLAGLISPEIIPIIRDEDELLKHLQGKEVEYLMTLEDWYRSIGDGAEVIYRSSGTEVILAGGRPMVIYRYNWDGD